jgi:hypothetical protein
MSSESKCPVTGGGRSEVYACADSCEKLVEDFVAA